MVGLLLCSLCLVPIAAGQEPEPAKLAMVAPLPPQQALESFELPAGYRLELVASEPMIEEPTVLAWDGNGRMYVAEMRTYMQDVDGGGELAPRSRVSRLEDTDGDGVMDRHSVFIDGLVLPRMILTLQDGIVVRETGTLDLFEYRDRDGDGVADDKRQVYEGGPRGGNLEHQPSGLDWNLDNNLYVTYTDRRYRYTAGEIVAEPLPAGHGQWGVTHDDYGQLYFSLAGGEVPALGFQQGPQYGRLKLPGELAEGFVEVWPLVEIADVQGGLDRVRDNDTLNHFTGCCGQAVFRGDRLPADVAGDLFIAEPVGRLIRRAEITMEDGVRVLRNADPGREFLRSRDPNFRPVHLYTGPDGALYIVDMYRGIIQEGNWVREDSYLRGVVQAYGLDRNIGRGRIYRLVHEGFEPGPAPRMLDEPTAELVDHLTHPNGWWRDNAQKLIVLRGDVTVAPELRRLMEDHADPRVRIHAMWTLDGLESLTRDDLLALFGDPAPEVRAAAVQASESRLQRAPDEGIVAAIGALLRDADAEVGLQVGRTAARLRIPGHQQWLAELRAAHPEHRGIAGFADAHLAVLAAEQVARERRREAAALAAAVERGSALYQSLCFTCHGVDGRGARSPGTEPLRLAPSLVGSPRVRGSVPRLARIVMQGLSGPVDGVEYSGVMAPMATFGDQRLADVLTYVRNSWGHEAGLVPVQQVAEVRASTTDRGRPWTLAELEPFDPPLLSRQTWRLSASVHESDLRFTIDGDDETRWTTKLAQRPGEWLAIEWSRPVAVEAVELSTANSPEDFPAGYRIEVRGDGAAWRTVAEGAGAADRPVIRFASQPARQLRITQTGHKDGKWWSVHELRVYGEGVPPPE